MRMESGSCGHTKHDQGGTRRAIPLPISPFTRIPTLLVAGWIKRIQPLATLTTSAFMDSGNHGAMRLHRAAACVPTTYG